VISDSETEAGAPLRTASMSLFLYSDSSHSIKPGSRFQRGRREDGGSIRSSAARFASRFACARGGEWLAFTSVRQGFQGEAALHVGNPQPGGEICVMRADGSDVRVLTDDQYEEGTPTWVAVPTNGPAPKR